jgi:hypothetical protein
MFNLKRMRMKLRRKKRTLRNRMVLRLRRQGR